MSRRRLALTVLAGVILGFFLCLSVVSLTDSGTPGRSAARVLPADAGAAAAKASAVATASYGAMQAQVHGAGVTRPQIVAFIRVLNTTKKSNRACPCPAVFQLQRALKAAHLRTGKATGVYGLGTAREVQAFQRRVHLPPSGVYGIKTHRPMQRYYDKAGRQRLAAIQHTRVQIIFRGRIVHAAAVAWSKRGLMRYSQSATRGLLPSLPAVPFATDCSGYATWLYKVSGLPDPNGFGYRIVGYTGTLAQHGTRIPASGPLKVGDLVFYGGGYPYGHVAIVVNGFLGLVSSHGSPGIKVITYRYRAVSAVRRYF